MRAVPLLLLLASCATTAAPTGDLPSRAALQEAVTSSDRFCESLAATDPATDCYAVPDRRVDRHRCRADPVPDQPSRVLCRYAGIWSWRYLQRSGRFRECAYLSRTQWGWQIDTHPDDGVCETI